MDRLDHRLLRADALEHCVSADSVGQLLDAGNAVFAALSHDVGRAELAGQLLARLVAAHRDDALRTHLLGREHGEEADCAVTDDRDRHTGLDIGRIGGEPACAKHIGDRQQARDLVRGHARGRDECPVGQRHAQQRRLRPSNELAVDGSTIGSRPDSGDRCCRKSRTIR
jgi:hypothetical protein